MVWHTIRATIYDPATEKILVKRIILDSNHLDVLVLQLAEELVKATDAQAPLPPGPIHGCLLVAVEVISWHSSTGVVMPDTAAESTLQKMRNSVAAFLSSGGSSPFRGWPANSSDSSQN